MWDVLIIIAVDNANLKADSTQRNGFFPVFSRVFPRIFSGVFPALPLSGAFLIKPQRFFLRVLSSFFQIKTKRASLFLS
jgi:hypothetical protein